MLDPDSGQTFHRNRRTFGCADDDRRDAGQNPQAATKVIGVCRDDQRGIAGQRVRIHRCHENGGRGGLRMRNLAERASPQRGPQTRAQQVFTDRRGVDPFQFGVGVSGEGFFFTAIHLDDHRLQHALCPPIDRRDRTGCGRGEVHPGIFLVGKENLPQLDPVTDLNSHGRFHSVVVRSQHGHSLDQAGLFNGLNRCSVGRQIHSSPYTYHSVNLLCNVLWFSTSQTAGPQILQLGIVPD